VGEVDQHILHFADSEGRGRRCKYCKIRIVLDFGPKDRWTRDAAFYEDPPPHLCRCWVPLVDF
jgi:hypothetical protein